MVNRRSFIASAASAYLTCCNCSRLASAALSAHGCRSAAAGNDDFAARLAELPAPPERLVPGIVALYDYKEVKKTIELSAVHQALADLRPQFGVRPGVALFDDKEGPNALATPRPYIHDGHWAGPDGTVALGGRLLGRLSGLSAKPFDRYKGGAQGPYVHLVVVAHEFAHILQFKSGMRVDGPWQMEPHADFLAGWAIARAAPGSFPIEAIRLLFRMGDTLFNSPAHHGQPELRGAMVRAGFESGSLSVEAVFKKGLDWAGFTF